MGVGDEILAAGLAQRVYEANPSQRVAICDIHNAVRWHPIWEGNPAIATPDAVARGESVQRIISGPHARPYIVYPFTAQSGWTFNRTFKAREHRARIYLTAAELALGEDVRALYGPYVLIEPWSKHANLRWPMDAWRALVASLPHLTFVQHIHAGSMAEGAVIPGIPHVPATFREACGLAAACQVYVRGESGMVHAAAALGVRQVTIWGACMDWDVMGGYPGQTGLLNYTEGSPCGQWAPCPHCAEAMAGIGVHQVADALTAAVEA